MPKPPYAVSSAGAVPSRGEPGALITLRGTRVPSLDVANSRVTSYPDRSTGVVVPSAVGRGASPRAATHHVAGSVKDSHDQAIRSCPSAERRAEYDDTELIGGISTAGSGPPLPSKARICCGPPPESTTHTVSRVTARSSM